MIYSLSIDFCQYKKFTAGQKIKKQFSVQVSQSSDCLTGKFGNLDDFPTSDQAVFMIKYMRSCLKPGR